jgi:hypothetical protein
MIVAGDGNAYIPYGQGVLRFSPDGTYNEISLGAQTATYVITNGDSGVAVFGEGCADNANATCYTLTLVSNDVVTAQAEFVLSSGGGPSPGSGFSPTLQREDGSYIGADTYGNLFAIGLDGSVVWQQQITTAPPGSNAPPVYPLYATADGGAIVTSSARTCPPGDLTNVEGTFGCLSTALSPVDLGYGQLGTLYTVDQNGNVTSQMLDPGTMYSWKAAYASTGDPVLNQVPPYFDLATIAASHAAIAGGSLMHNGFYIKNHTFGLVFCGPEGDGPCPSDVTPMTFSYIPQMTISNYLAAVDFSQTHPEYVATIRNAALNAYINAFSKLPAIVSQKVGLMWNGGKLFSSWPGQSIFEHTVFIAGNWPLPSQVPCAQNGQTFGWNWSEVYFLAEVCNAQTTLVSNPAMQVPDTSDMQNLVAAIGTGIGNSAVHELGWQLQNATYNPYPIEGMGCGGPSGLLGIVQSCEDSDGSDYEYYKADDSTYGLPPAIHWQRENVCNLEKYLLNSAVVKGCN